MKTIAVLLAGAMLVSACGGGGRVDRAYGGASAIQFASGPVSSACRTSGRKAANARLCGCIQGVANQSLSGADQRMAVKFFRDPHQAQEVRQSDKASHEAFWQRYKAFSARAEQVCTGL